MIESYFQPLTYQTHTEDGYSRTLGTAQTGQGFIQPVGGNESFQHFNLAARVTARLYCPVGLNVKHGDIVTQDGIAYNVLYSEQPNGIAGTGSHKEVLLGRVESGN